MIWEFGAVFRFFGEIFCKISEFHGVGSVNNFDFDILMLFFKMKDQFHGDRSVNNLDFDMLVEILKIKDKFHG